MNFHPYIDFVPFIISITIELVSPITLDKTKNIINEKLGLHKVTGKQTDVFDVYIIYAVESMQSISAILVSIASIIAVPLFGEKLVGYQIAIIISLIIILILSVYYFRKMDPFALIKIDDKKINHKKKHHHRHWIYIWPRYSVIFINLYIIWLLISGI